MGTTLLCLLLVAGCAETKPTDRFDDSGDGAGTRPVEACGYPARFRS